jgi:hypothetical protein
LLAAGLAAWKRKNRMEKQNGETEWRNRTEKQNGETAI